MINSYFEFLGLDIDKKTIITVIGSGGKTTVISEMAQEAVKNGKTALIMTTTKIYIPKDNNALTIFNGSILEEIRPKKPSIIYGGRLDSNFEKLTGFCNQDLNKICRNPCIDFIFIEGDGSAGRPIKAHRDYEPVVPDYSDLLIAVMGLNALNQEINAKNVHRVDDFIHRIKKKMNRKISSDDMVDIIIHSEGYFKIRCKKNYLIFNQLNEGNFQNFEYMKNRLLKEAVFIDGIEGKPEKNDFRNCFGFRVFQKIWQR
jgi:probable selenium-dependent hydroxylase accessory protein YqeC